jgi:general secretion pathway protein D
MVRTFVIGSLASGVYSGRRARAATFRRHSLSVGQFRPILAMFVVCLASSGAAMAANAGAEKLAKQAEKAERAGHVIEAYLLYAQAAAADPHTPEYWTHAQSLRPAAEMLSDKKLPVLGEKQDTKLPPNPISGSLTPKELDEIDRMMPPPRLKPVPGVRDFNLKADAKSLFEQVAAVYGYTVIFDKDYGSQVTIRFNITGIDYKGALHALEEATNSFIVPLSDRVMLVAQDTTQKRGELETNEALGVPIPQRTSVQEAQELAVMVQQSLELKRVVMDPGKRMIYMRDRASKVELAQAILSQLSGGKPQVSIDVEFISVGSNTSMSFGLHLPTSFPLVNFGSVLHSTPSIPAGFMRFLTFGAGRTFMGLGISDAQLCATASRSDASSLYKVQMTASDGQPATLHVGDKYPIVTAAYLGLGGLQAGSGSTTYAAISASSYADISTTAISTTGKMKLVVNGQAVPFTIPPGANSMIGVENIINSLQLGIGAATISRGTPTRPYTLLVVASTLGINSIQLYDDPDGANIALLKTPDQESSMSASVYPDQTTARVSSTGMLNLTVGSQTFALNLTSATNNLNGLRDAINQANAGVTAAVLTTGIEPNPFYLQVVATTPNSGAIQVYDDPSGANTPLLESTDQLNQSGNSLGQQVAGQNTSLGQAYAPPPTFNFEDLGILMKITPYVHDVDEVTLEVDAEFKVLGSGSYNGVPVISSRKFQGKVRLRTSEYAVVAGLMSETQARSITGLAGLSSIPLLGTALRENNSSRDSSQVLIVIKPHVTSLPAGEFATRTFWFGSETKPLTIL